MSTDSGYHGITAESHTYENAAVAFGLVCAAGVATALGAAVVFFPKLVKLASRRVLAGSLAFSAGVMTYVSFVEIFAKSVLAFQDAGWAESYSYIYATLSFFGGVVVMKIVDMGVHFFLRDHGKKDDDSSIHITHCEVEGTKLDEKIEEEIFTPHCVGCADDPIAELEEWHQKAEEDIKEMHPGEGNGNYGTQKTVASEESYNAKHRTGKVTRSSQMTEDGEFAKQEMGESGHSKADEQSVEIHPPQDTSGKVVLDGAMFDPDVSPSDLISMESSFKPPPAPVTSEKQEKRRLVRMGLAAALAIGLHNFPEGLATFVAALDDPRVGVVLTVAIGIHNIPEGMCVALPIYYATGNRWRAFKWGCVSGLSEPIAAALGWLVLANAVSDNVYGVLFGWTSGMMVIISLKELIPTAHRYDPHDTVVTNCVIVGMALIALSLVLFKI